MKGILCRALLATCVILAGLACREPRPLDLGKPVPAGTVLIRFNKKVQGPLELTIDGTRIPVEQAGRKKGLRLVVSGLAQGRHLLVLMSPLEAFGPDQFAVDLGPAQGVFQVVFAQQFQSALYGTPEPAPAAAGIPGVKARLEP